MHKFLLISSVLETVGGIWAGSKLQVVCKEIHCNKVSFSTFTVVVTRAPRFKRLNSLLCLLHNLQNCKQRATRKAQILPLSTLRCPVSKRSLSAGSLLWYSAFCLGTFFQIAKLPIYYAHTYNYLHPHTCVRSAGCPHSGPSARLALCPPRRWSVHFTKAGLSGSDGLWWAAKSPPFSRDESLPAPLKFLWHTTGARPLACMPKQRRFQRGKKRGELTGTSDCDPALLCGGDYSGQCCCAWAQASHHLTLTLAPIKYNRTIVRWLNRHK